MLEQERIFNNEDQSILLAEENGIESQVSEVDDSINFIRNFDTNVQNLTFEEKEKFFTKIFRSAKDFFLSQQQPSDIENNIQEDHFSDEHKIFINLTLKNINSWGQSAINYCKKKINAYATNFENLGSRDLESYIKQDLEKIPLDKLQRKVIRHLLLNKDPQSQDHPYVYADSIKNLEIKRPTYFESLRDFIFNKETYKRPEIYVCGAIIILVCGGFGVYIYISGVSIPSIAGTVGSAILGLAGTALEAKRQNQNVIKAVTDNAKGQFENYIDTLPLENTAKNVIKNTTDLFASFMDSRENISTNMNIFLNDTAKELFVNIKPSLKEFSASDQKIIEHFIHELVDKINIDIIKDNNIQDIASDRLGDFSKQSKKILEKFFTSQDTIDVLKEKILLNQDIGKYKDYMKRMNIMQSVIDNLKEHLKDESKLVEYREGTKDSNRFKAEITPFRSKHTPNIDCKRGQFVDKIAPKVLPLNDPKKLQKIVAERYTSSFS